MDRKEYTRLAARISIARKSAAAKRKKRPDTLKVMGITMENEYEDARQQVNAILKPKPVGRPKKSDTKKTKTKVGKESATEASATDLVTVEPKELTTEELAAEEQFVIKAAAEFFKKLHKEKATKVGATDTEPATTIAPTIAVSSETLEESVDKAVKDGDLIIHVRGLDTSKFAAVTAETAADESEDCNKDYNKDYNPDETPDEYDDDNDNTPGVVSDTP